VANLMAHFAHLDDNNSVTQIIVISNADMIDDNGIEQEALGIAVCEAVAGPGPWVQTSYNGNFRKKYASIGDIYQADADVFYNPVSPFPSWLLDANCDWQAPSPKPDDGNDYYWDEESLTWLPAPLEEPDPQE
jgi:hypothetical protein